MHNLALLSVFLALPPAFFWGYFFYMKDQKEPEPLRFMILAFLYGLGAGAIIMSIQYFLSNYTNWTLVKLLASYVGNIYPILFVSVILLAFLEELIKSFAVVRMIEVSGLKFNQIVDGIEYCVAAALGFAFVENTFYFLTNFSLLIQKDTFWAVFMFRTLGTMLAHAIFSGLFGYFLAVAKFSKNVCRDQKKASHHFHRHIKNAFKFHIFRKHIMKNRHSVHGHEPGVLITEGLIIASLLHIIFNMLNVLRFGETTLAYLNVPFIMFCLWYILHLFDSKENMKIRKKT